MKVTQSQNNTPQLSLTIDATFVTILSLCHLGSDKGLWSVKIMEKSGLEDFIAQRAEVHADEALTMALASYACGGRLCLNSPLALLGVLLCFS